MLERPFVCFLDLTKKKGNGLFAGIFIYLGENAVCYSLGRLLWALCTYGGTTHCRGLSVFRESPEAFTRPFGGAGDTLASPSMKLPCEVTLNNCYAFLFIFFFGPCALVCIYAKFTVLFLIVSRVVCILVKV